MMTYFEFYRVVKALSHDGRYNGRSMGGIREVSETYLPCRSPFK